MASAPQYFTSAHVAKLTGLSERRIRAWARSGFYRPESGGAHLFRFRDVVALRTLAVLADEHGISLRGKRGLRKLGEWLREDHETPWASLRFFVTGREVQFRSPDGKAVSGFPYGQTTDHRVFEVKEVVASMEKAAKKLNERGASERGKVIKAPRGVMGGQRIFAGTRIPLSAVQEFIAAGYSTKKILQEYPSLTAADIEVARAA